MRRVIYSVLVLIMTMLVALPAYASPRVVLDKKIMEFDTQPIIQNGTTLVPLRAIFEALGATVSWDATTSRINARKGSVEITLTVGQREAGVNEKNIMLAVAPQVVNGRTLVPLRFISEALGADVDWDGRQEIAIIKTTKAKTIEQKTPTGNLVKVHFINVGNAEAIYISLPNRKNILIDSGRDDLYRDVPLKVVTYLKDQGVESIDVLVSSAPLKDYLGYLESVFNNFTIGKVIEAGFGNPIREYSDFKSYSRKSQSIETANRQHFDFENVSFDVLTSPVYWENARDYSVVTKLTYGDVSFLFTGAASTKALNNIQGNLSAKILKVADHGSKDSVSKEFLSKVNPETAVIFAGNNPFGNPDKDVLGDLLISKVKVYRTDDFGTIIINTDGKVYETITENKSSPSVPVPATTKYLYFADLEKNVYHKHDCPILQELDQSKAIRYEYSSDAMKDGFTPCKVCID